MTKNSPLSEYLIPLRQLQFHSRTESESTDPFQLNFKQNFKIKKRELPTIKEEEEKKAQSLISTVNMKELFLLRIDLSKVMLYPINFVEGRIYTVEELIQLYFPSKSAKLLPFSVRIFNALTLTSVEPLLEYIFGVKWISQDIFKVNLTIYKQFYKFGNLTDGFNNNGFITPLNYNDSKNIVFYQHISQHFHIGSTYQDLNFCDARMMIK